MKPATKARILKFFRTSHAWLGLFIFPWVLVIGLTGIYLNHKSLVLDWLDSSRYDESRFAEWPVLDMEVGDALPIAQSIWPDEDITGVKGDVYHDMDSFVFTKDSGKIIITRATGHYFVKSNLSRQLYAPDGTLLDRKIYWKSVFKWLHARGWLNSTPGTWLADLTGVAMVIFSISGLFIFFMPRTKKIVRAVKRLKPEKSRSAPARQET